MQLKAFLTTSTRILYTLFATDESRSWTTEKHFITPEPPLGRKMIQFFAAVRKKKFGNTNFVGENFTGRFYLETKYRPAMEYTRV
jgi:hypothetical protein